MLHKTSKIYVAGHTGLVGSAILRRLERDGYSNLTYRKREELNLEDVMATVDFFKKERPEIVFMAAAKVGGIHANNTYPVEFIMSNLLVQANIFRAAYEVKVPKVIFLGSSCIYPRDCPQPIKEEYFLSGTLESTNRAYAIAKIAGVEMCWSYNREYQTQWLAVMPTNLYGPGDHYDLKNSHVLPALIRKIHEAKMNQLSEVVLWGSGRARREFLYVDDMVDALIYLATLSSDRFGDLVNPLKSPLINIGSGKDLMISELADTIAKVIGYQGQFIYDVSMPDGTMQKLLDIEKISHLGWTQKVKLSEGISLAYQDYLKRFN